MVDACFASFQTGDYSTDCDNPNPNHSDPHEGPDPFGNDTRVRWEGGGSCAGDPLPYHNVVWL